LTVEENAKNVRGSTGPRIGDSGPYAEENDYCGLQNESEAAGACQALRKVFQKSARKEIEAAVPIGILQRIGNGGDQNQNDQEKPRIELSGCVSIRRGPRFALLCQSFVRARATHFASSMTASTSPLWIARLSAEWSDSFWSA